QEGMYEQDPRANPDAAFISEAQAGDPRLLGMASGSGGALGRGGMATKVQAAARAARSGTATLIAHGRGESVLQAIAAGQELGTLFHPPTSPMAARKRWLAGQLQARGKLVLDAGAVRVLRES